MAFLIFVCIFIAGVVICAVKFHRAGYLAAAAKGALGSFLIFLLGCFVFGLFNDFSFWHGSSRAGPESGLAYAVLLGISVGPIVFALGGLIAASIVYRGRNGRGQ